jgi:alkaline phosphatase
MFRQGSALLATLALATSTAGCTGREKPPRAVILLIGDGFGFSQLTLARLAIVKPGERLRLESMPVTGIVSTWSASNPVTDSGAAATAFSSGVKTDNRFLGLDREGHPVATLGEAAKRAGWRVGYVTTTRITHATPACFYAHHRDRYDEATVAVQLLESDVDLAVGGGRSQFLPVEQGGARLDGRDLLAEAPGRGWKLLVRGDAPRWDGSGRLLGLFANDHLGYELDDRNYPPERLDPLLADLASMALDGLGAAGRPFFLMIEGGRIDHAGHDFDAAGVVEETRRFDEAVGRVLAWARDRSDVLVLLTADHATGGLAINDYARIGDLVRRTASVAWMAGRIRNAGGDSALLAEHTGYDDFTEEEVAAIRTAPDAYEANRRLGARLAERDGLTWIPRVSESDTKGHTGEDVPLFASGRGAERFAGVLDNTEVALRLASLLGWEVGATKTGG